MNYRNFGEDGPCLFTRGASDVDQVIQDNPEIFDTEFKITLVKNTLLNKENL